MASDLNGYVLIKRHEPNNERQGWSNVLGPLGEDLFLILPGQREVKIVPLIDKTKAKDGYEIYLLDKYDVSPSLEEYFALRFNKSRRAVEIGESPTLMEAPRSRTDPSPNMHDFMAFIFDRTVKTPRDVRILRQRNPNNYAWYARD